MVEVRDLGIGKLRQDLERASQIHATAGIHKEEGSRQHPDADIPIAALASMLEYGTEDTGAEHPMEARPFVASALEEHGKELNGKLAQQISGLIDGRISTPEDAMKGLADLAGKRMLEHFDRARDWAAPLADATVERKEHDQPLLDTGTVREAIRSKVSEKRALLE